MARTNFQIISLSLSLSDRMKLILVPNDAKFLLVVRTISVKKLQPFRAGVVFSPGQL